ncbi:MAG TPA: glutamate synthase large subunit, partial [Permianibacter sp.]|nr:glutamate synthase large subunit [Permianibacter sp.]
MQSQNPANRLLYSPRDERDNCGFGLIADMAGKASHELLATALTALANLSHRGAIGADGKTGDGCGILMAMPEAFFRQYAGQAHLHLTPQFAVGMVFLPTDAEAAKRCRDELTKQLRQELLTVAGWREVPTDPSVLGQIASASLPRIEQVLVNSPAGWSKHDLERRLFMARRRTEKALAEHKAFYICSLSGLVIVYKALAMPVDLTTFYPDLKDPRLTTSIALFHQRFSTNTTPQWRLAQPFRFLAHNGEINTISGNRAWARARGPKFITPLIPDLQT